METNPAPRLVEIPARDLNTPAAGTRQAKNPAYWRAVRFTLDISEETPENVAYHYAVRRCLDISSESVPQSPPAS